MILCMHMKKTRIFLLLLSSVMISSCTLVQHNSSGGSSNNNETNTEGQVDDNSIQKGTILAPDYSYQVRKKKEDITIDDLFNLHNKVEILINVDKEELDKIQEDNNRGHKPEIYHLAKEVTIKLTNNSQTFTWEFENVGIRQKGNLSREPVFDGNKVNTHNHYKLSFDETFTDTEMYSSDFIATYGNGEYGNREFLGLSGLDFKWNRNLDETNVKEIYASYMYKSAGIISQKVGLSSLKMKVGDDEVNFGVCFMFEPSSKSIIKRKFSENEKYINTPNWNIEKKGTFGVEDKKYGDFYKSTYGSGDKYSYGGGADLTSKSIQEKRVGVKTDIYGNNYPVYERKTNKESTYGDTLIKGMVQTLNSGSYDNIDTKVDLEYFAIEEAVSYYLGNPDSVRYNYNNYMMYFRRTDGKMMLLPIDNDRTFGIGHTWDKGTTFGANVNTTPLSKKDVSGNTNRNPLFTKALLTSSDNACKTLFMQYINLIAESDWVKNDTFVRYFNIAKETYGELTTFNLSGGQDNMSFESYIAIKLESVKKG